MPFLSCLKRKTKRAKRANCTTLSLLRPACAQWNATGMAILRFDAQYSGIWFVFSSFRFQDKLWAVVLRASSSDSGGNEISSIPLVSCVVTVHEPQTAKITNHKPRAARTSNRRLKIENSPVFEIAAGLLLKASSAWRVEKGRGKCVGPGNS